MAMSSLRSFRELLLLGESALKSGFSDLDECRIVQSDEVDLTKLPQDDLGTSLIPDDIAAKPLRKSSYLQLPCQRTAIRY